MKEGFPLAAMNIFQRMNYGRFELKTGGLAYDPENDIEWFRCSVGQRLVNEECLGVPMIVSWSEAVANIEEINTKSGTRVAFTEYRRTRKFRCQWLW